MNIKPATDKQLSYIRALISRAGLPADTVLPSSSAGASEFIEQLKLKAANFSASNTANTPALVAEGVYRRSSDGAMFRVQTSEQGRRYAKTLLPSGGWGYERGAIFTLAASERLTLAQLEEWGLSTGVCAICGRLLSTAESVARGIGPVCASRY